MLNSEQIALASRLLERLFRMRKEREYFKSAQSFEICSFLTNTTHVPVPADSIEAVRAVAVRALNDDIGSTEEALKGMGVTAE